MTDTTTRRDVLLAGLAVTATGVAAGQGTTQGRFRVALAGDFEQVALQLAPWNSLGDDVDVVSFSEPFETSADTVNALRDFDAVVLMRERVPLPRDVIENLPRLKLAVFSGHMNATLDHRAAAERGIVVCNALGFGGDDDDNVGGIGGPAELSIALMLACAWHIPSADSLIRKGGWIMQPDIPFKIPLGGRTLGIVGYGSIGTRVGELAKAFDMRVMGFSRSLTDEIASANGVVRADLETLLRNSDVVSVHLPLTLQTRGMLGAEQLGWMKPGAVFINTARAPIVDEAALVDALRTRRISMAGFDVFYEEPLPQDHPFVQMPNVVMTPHIGWVSESGMVGRYKALLEVVEAFRRGEVINRYTPGARDLQPAQAG